MAGILFCWCQSLFIRDSSRPQALSGDKEHDPTDDDGGADKEGEAVDAIAEHAAWSFALGDAEDGGGKEREKHDSREVGGVNQSGFLPVRRLWASTAAMTLSKPATTMNLVP